MCVFVYVCAQPHSTARLQVLGSCIVGVIKRRGFCQMSTVN